MHRRQFLAASALGAVASVAGCAGNPLTTGSNENDIPSSDSNESNAPDSNDGWAGETEISVGARGEVETEPDQATASVGVQATGESAEAVNEELAERSETLRETFADLEIPDENVETGRYDIREGRNGTGYEGTYTFAVTVEDVDRVGEVVDAAVDAGADDVGRVSFGLSDERRAEMRDDAVDHALENADDEAAHLADNRGVEIVATRSVSTSSHDVVPVEHEADADLAADDAPAQTDFDTGPVSVSATVDVVYVAE